MEQYPSETSQIGRGMVHRLLSIGHQKLLMGGRISGSCPNSDDVRNAMIRTFAVLSFALLLAASSPTASAQDASVPAAGLDWYPFEEAIDLARHDKKKVIVDVYAVWCPWCRRLQAEVYTDPAVQSYVEKNFILTRLDAENQNDSLRFREHVLTPADLALGLGAQGFPTTVFLDEESEYITRLPGFLEAQDFFTVLAYVGSNAFMEQSYQEFAEKLKE